MKAHKTLVLLAILFTSCAPVTSPTPSVTEEVVQLLTPASPPGTILFDGCMYMVSYPPRLTTVDGILFESADEGAASVFITARRRMDAEEALSLEELAVYASERWASTSQSNPPLFEAAAVTDYMGDTLDGLEADLVVDEGQHARYLIVVRPETLLGDMLYDDVVYEVVAQAPDAAWSEWAPLFDVVFQTFHPKSCGGV
jgi:hypothetical protein